MVFEDKKTKDGRLLASEKEYAQVLSSICTKAGPFMAIFNHGKRLKLRKIDERSYEKKILMRENGDELGELNILWLLKHANI